jgi:phosphoglycolate phosphatase
MRAVIFDFDGTIADSLKVLVEVAHDITGKIQLVDADELQRLRAMRLKDVAEELQIPKWRWPFLVIQGRRKMANRMKEVQPFPGIADVLSTLQATKYEIFMVTSNSQRNVDRFLATTGMGAYFAQVYGNVGIFGKARVLKKVLRQHNLQPRDAMYVGDEPRDVEAAKKAGIPCVAVTWGYSSGNILNEHTPMVVVHDIKQLQSAIQEWGGAL